MVGQKPTLLLFDLDRTITRLPTYTPFLLHAARRLAPWRLALIPVLVPVFAAYGLKLIDRRTLKTIMQRTILGGRVRQEHVAQVSASFAKQTFNTNCYTAAKALINEAQAIGTRVVLATASHRFYAAAIAQKLGVADVIATESTWQDGALTPTIPGENCYGAAKLKMVQAWFKTQGIDRESVYIRFYSDHVSDLASFDWCDEPVAVHPSSKLRALARARGWTICDW